MTRLSAARSRRTSARLPAAISVVRVERPSAIPIESLHGRKDNLGRSLRLVVRTILAPADLGDFSLQPGQGEVRAVFVPLKRLQQDLEVPDKVNALLVAERADRRGGTAALETLIRRRFALEDVGVSVRALAAATAVESAAGLVDPPRVKAIDAAAVAASMRTQAILTYLANVIRHGDRQVPYSLVTAMDLSYQLGGPERAALPGTRRRASRSGGESVWHSWGGPFRAAIQPADCAQRLDRARAECEGRRAGHDRILRLGRSGPAADAHR